MASLRLEVRRSRWPLTANPAFAKSLGRVIGTLNAARTTGGHQLEAARHPGDQATAARRLARAHDAAATAPRDSHRVRSAPTRTSAIVAALRRLSSAYASLAHAAAAQRQAPVRGAQAPRSRAADAALSDGVRPAAPGRLLDRLTAGQFPPWTTPEPPFEVERRPGVARPHGRVVVSRRAVGVTRWRRWRERSGGPESARTGPVWAWAWAA